VRGGDAVCAAGSLGQGAGAAERSNGNPLGCP